MPSSKRKDPQDVLEYGFRWAAWLAGDTIETSSWSLEPDDDELVIDQDLHTDDITTVWLSGGLHLVNYRVTNHIETAGGREKDRSFTLYVRQE